MNQIAAMEPRQSLIVAMANRYNMEPKAFADTLRATVVPKSATNEEFAAFLMVAKEYSLNPITKEIYAFPKQGGGIQPIVSVDGWANLINSHPQCDGVEFDDSLAPNGDLISITCRMYRKDRSRPTTATEYMTECKRDTSTWKQWPRRMLRHKALIQAARYAFGFAGIVDPDEAERFTRAPPAPAAVAPMSPPPAPRLAAPKNGATKPAPVAVAQEVEPSLPGDWGDYLARMNGELDSADAGAARTGVVDTVADAIMGALERGEIDDIDAARINGAWAAMSKNAEGSG